MRKLIFFTFLLVSTTLFLESCGGDYQIVNPIDSVDPIPDTPIVNQNFLKYLAPTPQRSGDPIAGYDYLINGDYVQGADVDMDVKEEQDDEKVENGPSRLFELDRESEEDKEFGDVQRVEDVLMSRNASLIEEEQVRDIQQHEDQGMEDILPQNPEEEEQSVSQDPLLDASILVESPAADIQTSMTESKTVHAKHTFSSTDDSDLEIIQPTAPPKDSPATATSPNPRKRQCLRVCSGERTSRLRARERSAMR